MRSGNLFDPGFGIEKTWIRDKHPGSATLIKGTWIRTLGPRKEENERDRGATTVFGEKWTNRRKKRTTDTNENT